MLRVTSENPDARLQSAIMPDSARASCAKSRPIPIYATNASLRLDGRASLPPCRGTSRGRMRGVGATCTAPTTHGRPKRMKAQEYGKIRAARNQRCRYLSFPLSFPSERRLSPRSDRSLGLSPADRRAGLATSEPMHRHSRSARRGVCSAGRMTGRPRYSARRAKVRFGGECGGSRAVRADGTGVWVIPVGPSSRHVCTHVWIWVL